MAKAKKALFTSFGLLNFQERKVLNEGNAFFEATPEGGKSDKTFCVTLDDGKQMYCYVSNEKIAFYKANLDGTHKQWLFNIFPDGGIFSAQSIENKKRKKEQARAQEQKTQQTGAQKPERRTLTLPNASQKKAPVVVEITKKKR
ncbi:hypothetical protein [Acetobacter orientalis]|uniref:hypothetical protein n=1 Tax=Acetobacter orientalis TaxID=146474 RepID=UPI0039E820AB